MDPLNLQKQLHNNSSDLLNFYDELKHWGEEMKRKDESLKTGTESIQMPASKVKVRKTVDSDKPKPEKNKAKAKTSKRFKGTDYSAWEKFDVDVECAKLDEEKTEGDDSGDLTDECDENARDEAIYEKEKGNKFVKLQKWDEAIECYTKAIGYYGYDPVFYANRALCYLKKQDYHAAETDCTNALRFDKTYVKAYQRRAAARESLNQLSEAHDDLLKVFDYEPNNKESKAALIKLEKKLENFNKEACAKKLEVQPKSKFTISQQERKKHRSIEHQNQTSTSRTDAITKSQTRTKIESIQSKPQEPKIVTYWPSGNEVELVETVYKPPHLRSKKSLKRIEILDADGTKFDSCNEIREVKTRPVHSLKNQSAIPWPKPNNENSVIKVDELKIVERKPEDHNENKMSQEKPRKESKFSKDKSSQKIISDTNKNVINEGKDSMEFNFPVPETSVQFNTDWRLLKNRSEWRFLYLKQVNPKKFPVIFKESLDCDVFNGIIYTLAETFIEKGLPVYDYLLGLCEVKRFAMLTMFMSNDDKKEMFKLFDYMRLDNSLTPDNIDNLMRKYGL